MAIINFILGLPLQMQIYIAVALAALIVFGSFLFGFLEDIFLIAIAIILIIFLVNLLIPIIGPYLGLI